MKYFLTLSAVVPTNLTPLQLINRFYVGARPIPHNDKFYEKFVRVCEHPNILFKHPMVQLTDLTSAHSCKLPPGVEIPEGDTCELATQMAVHGITVLIYRITTDIESESGFMLTMRMLSSAAIDPYIRPILIDEILADLA